MKKKAFILLIILLLTSGCTARYDLEINDNSYNERITLTSTDSKEQNYFSSEYKIPVDKEEYANADETTNFDYENGTYNFNSNNNTLIFSNNFTKNSITNSTAISICYNTFTMNNYSGNIYFSTSNENKCFDKYPYLDSISINVTVDKNVKSNNADRVNGNTYTWVITRNNRNKGINIVLENDSNSISSSSNNYQNQNNEIQNEAKPDYTSFILAGILLLLFIIGYIAYKIITRDNESID